MAVFRDNSQWEFFDDFIGAGTFVTSAGLDPWVITDTSSSGTPTYTRLDHGETSGVFRPGVARLQFDSATEIQNVCLSFGNVLAFDINAVKRFECGVRFVAQTGSAKDSNTTVAWGLAGDRADTVDSIAYHALFRLKAADGSMAISCETDDGTNDKTETTGFTLTDNTWGKFVIDLSAGLSNVMFYAGIASGSMSRIATATTFDMSNYAAGLQPIFQLQKASDNNTDAFQIDYVHITGVRP